MAATDVSHDPSPLVFNRARLLQITYEISREACLQALPLDAGRPVPSYARLFVLDSAQQSGGTSRFCALFAGSRFRMMPRNAFADGLVAGDDDTLGPSLGGVFRPGNVSVTRDGQAARADVADSSGPLAVVTLPQLRAIDPAMLRWDMWLTFGSNDGVVQPLEVSVTAVADAAFLSKNATLEIPTNVPRGHLWREFRNLNTISACYLEGSVTLAMQPVAASQGQSVS